MASAIRWALRPAPLLAVPWARPTRLELTELAAFRRLPNVALRVTAADSIVSATIPTSTMGCAAPLLGTRPTRRLGTGRLIPFVGVAAMTLLGGGEGDPSRPLLGGALLLAATGAWIAVTPVGRRTGVSGRSAWLSERAASPLEAERSAVGAAGERCQADETGIDR